MSFILIISLQPTIFAKAQVSTTIDETNSSEAQFYIPPTVSKEAQEMLKSSAMNMPTFGTPEQNTI
jgi:hypothetical protein